MSNMKDFMMWLDDRGTATWDNTMGELIIPDEVDIYDENLVAEYQNDAKWHRPVEDDDEREDMIEDDDDDSDDFVEDDNEIGDEVDLDQQMGIISNLLETLFDGSPTSIDFTETLELDQLTALWNTHNMLKELMEYNDSTEYLFDENGGLTGDAQNYLHDLDVKGEFV